MTLYGLIGHPLGHSFSQRYFRDKFAREGIDADYLNFDISSADELRNVIASHPELRGLNCTIPHKQAVLPLMDELDADAAAIGAVNTIAIRDGRLTGYNTDCIGFEDSLRPLLKPCHTHALVLGTGGASKAVVYVLERLGIAATYVSRRPAEGRLTYNDLSDDVMSEHKLIVNCSPVGMYPHTDAAPEIPYRSLGSDHLLYDLIYNPEITLFMSLGRRRGATVVNGRQMLEGQAIASYRIWTSNDI